MLPEIATPNSNHSRYGTPTRINKHSSCLGYRRERLVWSYAGNSIGTHDTAADMTSREDVTARSAYVLDDDPGVRASVRLILTSIGYDALAFSAPAAMLAKLRASPPEVVVLDLALGQSDAVEVVRQLAILK